MSNLESLKLNAEIELLNTQIDKEKADLEYQRLANLLSKRDVDKILASPVSARTFTFWDTITDKYIANAVIEINTWSKLTPDCDINIVINSPGGSVFDGLAFYDFLRDLSRRGHKVITKGMGVVGSIATILFQAGDERIASPNTYFLLHDVSKHFPSGGSVSASFLRDEQKFLEDINQRLVDIAARRTTLSSDEVFEKIGYKEWWFDAQEALDIGFVDRIED